MEQMHLNESLVEYLVATGHVPIFCKDRQALVLVLQEIGRSPVYERQPWRQPDLGANAVPGVWVPT